MSDFEKNSKIFSRKGIKISEFKKVEIFQRKLKHFEINCEHFVQKNGTFMSFKKLKIFDF